MTVLQNTDLNLNVQAKFKQNVNLVICHVFNAALAFLKHSQWSVARGFTPAPLKTESLRPQTEVQCIECNKTGHGSRLINNLFIGFYFMP